MTSFPHTDGWENVNKKSSARSRQSEEEPGQEGDEEGQGEGGGGGRVAEITFTEAHVDLQHRHHPLLNPTTTHLLVLSLHEGAPLLVVAGRSLHALSLRGDAVVVVAEVLVEALHDLARVTVMSHETRAALSHNHSKNWKSSMRLRSLL